MDRSERRWGRSGMKKRRTATTIIERKTTVHEEEAMEGDGTRKRRIKE